MNSDQASRQTLHKFILNLIACSSLIFLPGCSKDTEEKVEIVRPVRAMQVTDMAQFRQRRFPGIARATQEIDLSFRVSGRMITRPVDVGDNVKTGDLVARIDPREYEIELNNVKGQLEKARANARRAQSEFEREMRIYQQDPGATSQVAVERKQAQRDQAFAEVKSLEAAVAAAKDRLSYTYLRAPFDGRVVNTYRENFDDVLAKQAIVRIIDNSRIEMIVNVPESLISLVPEVKNIEVVFDPFPGRKIPAAIKEIGTEASATTRTYPVTLIMNQPEDIEILPGMAGKASGEPPTDKTDLVPSSRQVPLTAILSLEDINKTFVWVIDKESKTVSRREVKTGRLTDTGIIITEGLNTGEWIATAGVHYLREGMEVKILEEQAE